MAIVAFLAFALTGLLSEPSAADVADQVAASEKDADVRCKVLGKNSLGDRVWKCGQTLTAKGGAPEDIVGERISNCYKLSEARNLESLDQESCDRVDPVNGGEPE